MNKFYLVLIKKDGTIVHDIFATCHNNLVAKYLTCAEVKDNDYFFAIFSPKKDCRLDDVNNYTLINSGMYYPDWFTGKFKLKIFKDLKDIINSMIVKSRKKLLLHEGIILSNKIIINEVKHCVIFGMYDESRINILDETSEIKIMTDDAFVNEMRDGSKITEMYGYAKVKKMTNYSKIIKMYGQAKVEKMYDHSKIGVLKGDANITEMHEKSKADRLKHMSRVNEMHGHSIIEELWDWSVVEKMFDHSKIIFMDQDSKVLEMYGDSIVDQMFGNAIVEKLYENSLVRKLNDRAQILNKEL